MEELTTEQEDLILEENNSRSFWNMFDNTKEWEDWMGEE